MGAEETYGDMVQVVVDVSRKVMAVGGGMHVDAERELLDATLDTVASRDRWRELAWLREVVCDLVLSSKVYQVKARHVEQYLLRFAYLARGGS